MLEKREPEQLDLVRFEDRRAALRQLLRDSVERLGLSAVAHLVNREPSTISHQLSGLDSGKRPSAELFGVCFLLDRDFRERSVGLLGEMLSKPPDLEPEDFAREAVALASSGEFGNHGGARLMALYARMRKAQR